MRGPDSNLISSVLRSALGQVSHAVTSQGSRLHPGASKGASFLGAEGPLSLRRRAYKHHQRRAETHFCGRWCWVQKDLSKCMTHFKAARGRKVRTVSHRVFGDIFSAQESYQPAQPLLPIAGRGSSSLQRQPGLGVSTSPALMHVAHCGLERTGKGGDFGNGSF